MLLGQILHKGVITSSLQAEDKFAAIEELTQLLVATGDIHSSLRDHVVEVVTAREQSMATGMEQGIALPHGASARIENIFGALGVSQRGIPFGCLDGRPATLIVLLVLPRDEFRVQVRTLAGISHLLNEDDFRKALIEAPNPDAILKLVRSEERSSVFDRFRLGR